MTIKEKQDLYRDQCENLIEAAKNADMNSNDFLLEHPDMIPIVMDDEGGIDQTEKVFLQDDEDTGSLQILAGGLKFEVMNVTYPNAKRVQQGRFPDALAMKWVPYWVEPIAAEIWGPCCGCDHCDADDCDCLDAD